jgi:hypothetical protein
MFVYRGIVQVQTADDSSGNNNTATLYNGPIWRTAGHIGGALQFDGTDDYAQTANSSTKLQLNSSLNYTLSAWVKPNGTQKDWAGIISKTDSVGGVNHWTLQFDSTTPTRKLIIYHPGGSWYTGITINDLVAGGIWHRIVIIRNGSTMTSYIDPVGGAAQKTESWTKDPGNGYGHLNIGADRTALSSYVYSGLIDDVRIYNRALTAGEVLSPPNDPNLIGYWKFNESAPNVTITAEPVRTAIITGSGSSRHRWSQAAGAFFRSISRR